MSQPKTTDQLRAIFGLGKEMNCEKSDLEELANDVTNGRTARLSQLFFDEANAMIKRLGGEAFPSGSKTPRRTENHRNQKGGVVKIVTAQQLKKMDDLAKKRGMSPEGLKKLCRRMLKTERPNTALGCSKVIEAIKAMNKRGTQSATVNKKAAA